MTAPKALPSKAWSCGSLVAGNEQLLAIKSEASRNQTEKLRAAKEAGV